MDASSSDLSSGDSDSDAEPDHRAQSAAAARPAAAQSSASEDTGGSASPDDAGDEDYGEAAKAGTSSSSDSDSSEVRRLPLLLRACLAPAPHWILRGPAHPVQEEATGGRSRGSTAAPDIPEGANHKPLAVHSK